MCAQPRATPSSWSGQFRRARHPAACPTVVADGFVARYLRKPVALDLPLQVGLEHHLRSAAGNPSTTGGVSVKFERQDLGRGPHCS